MTKTLSEILNKDVAELSEAEVSIVNACVDQLSEEQKEKFSDILEADEPQEIAVKAVYDPKEKIAVASTDVLDRHGERINQEGWDLKNFKKNPVLLWGHDHNEIAVGNARNIHIERAGGKPRLVFTPDFHEKTEKARALKSLFDEGWLNSFSVGFIPKDFDGKENTYLKQELLEISAVNVPANAEATMLAYKSLRGKGFEKSIVKELTGVEEKPQDNDEERGAVADEIAEEEAWEKKRENMSDAYEVWWAFCGVYFDEETDVDDFEKLLGETIQILGTVLDGTYESAGTDDEGDTVEDSFNDIDPDKITPEQAKKILAEAEKQNLIEKAKAALPLLKNKDTENKDEVLDNNSDNDDDNNKTAKTQVNKDTSVAPTINNKEARAKQSLAKVIAKASDKILADKPNTETADMAKVIKRAAEILTKSHKNN